ncbi:hypothetical protein [Cupriavidus basilensis]|uniref:hypothetical protein n=1 Tax=Cupriavidus basilensis TaxID=68895 RepID=UPI0020A6845F|nr:hypothetical protein [Cupriavidus basilensis]MCP3023186.1 hypothetical protein [Cupriavidus basilensis]MDR3383449.1 hypothetical protein [Cupriavidus basilensis]
MTDPVFHKTEQGQDEIRTRARKLDHKLRALLLIVNGERRRSELLAQTGGMGVGPESIDALLAAGLIRAENAPQPAAAATSPANPPASVDRHGDAKADSLFPMHSMRGANVPSWDDALPAPASPQPAGGTYQQLYHFYTDVIGHHLGLRGYLLQVKVEKAGSPAELAALRDPLYSALHKAKGEITAGAIIDQLDKMVRDDGHASA